MGIQRACWAAVMCAALLVACGGGPNTAAPPARIRVGFSGSVLLRSDLPFVLAHDALPAKGYVVDVKHFDSADLAAEALVRGDVDIVHGTVRNAWQAAEKGAPIKTVMERSANTYVIVARSEIRRCSDLNGRSLAIQGQASSTTLLVRNYIKANCPTAAPNYLIIANNDNRIAALAAGELDAGVLSVEYMSSLALKVPNRFAVLENLAASAPGLMLMSVSANTEFLAKQPLAMKDYIRATLEARRQLSADFAKVRNELVNRKMVEPEEADATAKALMDAAVWDPNGGMTRDSLERTVKYMVESGEFAKPPQLDRIADFTFLDQVLAEIGRR